MTELIVAVGETVIRVYPASEIADALDYADDLVRDGADPDDVNVTPIITKPDGTEHEMGSRYMDTSDIKSGRRWADELAGLLDYIEDVESGRRWA